MMDACLGEQGMEDHAWFGGGGEELLNIDLMPSAKPIARFGRREL